MNNLGKVDERLVQRLRAQLQSIKTRDITTDTIAEKNAMTMRKWARGQSVP